MPLLGSIDLCTSSATSQITGYRLAEALAAIRRSGCVGVCRGRPRPPYANDSENRLRLLAVILAVIAPGSGGDGWESNPPRTPQQRPANGFEDRGAAIHLGPWKSGEVRSRAFRFQDRPPVSALVRRVGCLLGCQPTHTPGTSNPKVQRRPLGVLLADLGSRRGPSA